MGFAAEIKEFLGAAKDSWKLMSDTEKKDAETKYTQAKTKETESEMNDPLNQQLKEAKLAHMKATTGQIGKAAPLSEYQRWLMAQASKPSQVAGAIGSDDTTPKSTPTYTETEDTGPGSAIDPIGPPTPRVRRYKSGGLVRKFAVGGIVDDEDLEDDEVTPGVTGPAVGGSDIAGFEEGTAQGGVGSDTLRRPAVGTPTPRPVPKELEAIRRGLIYGAGQVEQAGAVGGARQRAARGWAQGAGAAPPDEMVQIYQKIDPTGKKYTEGERNLVALQALYNFKKNSGDQQGADSAAFQIMQNYKTAQARYGALAAAAMQGGHVDEGIKLALKQYANIPDGNDLTMSRDEDTGQIKWSLKKGNKTLTGGIATPQEIGANAAKLATPGGYENYLTAIASGAQIKGAGKAVDKDETPDPMKDPAKRKQMQDDISEHVDNWYAAAKKDPLNKGKEEPKPAELAATKNMMYHALRNNDMTDDESLRRIQKFVTAPEDASQPGFRTYKDPDAKMRIIQFEDGATMKIPESDYGTFRDARTSHLKNEADKAKKEYDKAHGSSGLADAIEGVKAHREKARAETKELMEGVKSSYDTSTLKKAVGAAGSVASEASDWLSKAGKTIKEEGGAGAIGKAVGSVLGGGNAVAGPIDPTEDRPL